MTAEELAKDAFLKTWYANDENRDFDEFLPHYLESFLKMVIPLMQNYSKIKCAEQRQICADNADADYNMVGQWNIETFGTVECYVIKDSIINSPEPEI